VDKVEHFEIPADDVKRALDFYRTVFGWELNPLPGIDYTRLLTVRIEHNAVAQRPFEVNGAIVERNSEVRGPVVTISVSDMDDTLERIPKVGGRVVMGKKEFGKRGYTAYFQDTEGNVMGLWQVRRS
jgi:predicted enzyme related to lactoylglutathione lyase